jgi:hypothetical protein
VPADRIREVGWRERRAGGAGASLIELSSRATAGLGTACRYGACRYGARNRIAASYKHRGGSVVCTICGHRAVATRTPDELGCA